MIGSLPGLEKLLWLICFALCFWTGVLFAVIGAACFLVNKFNPPPNTHLSRIAYGTFFVIVLNAVVGIYFLSISDIKTKDLFAPEFYLFIAYTPLLPLSLGGEAALVTAAWLVSNALTIYVLGWITILIGKNA